MKKNKKKVKLIVIFLILSLIVGFATPVSKHKEAEAQVAEWFVIGAGITVAIGTLATLYVAYIYQQNILKQQVEAPDISDLLSKIAGAISSLSAPEPPPGPSEELTRFALEQLFDK